MSLPGDIPQTESTMLNVPRGSISGLCDWITRTLVTRIEMHSGVDFSLASGSCRPPPCRGSLRRGVSGDFPSSQSNRRAVHHQMRSAFQPLSNLSAYLLCRGSRHSRIAPMASELPISLPVAGHFWRILAGGPSSEEKRKRRGRVLTNEGACDESRSVARDRHTTA